jgi:hypothetical protein
MAKADDDRWPPWQKDRGPAEEEMANLGIHFNEAARNRGVPQKVELPKVEEAAQRLREEHPLPYRLWLREEHSLRYRLARFFVDVTQAFQKLIGR